MAPLSLHPFAPDFGGSPFIETRAAGDDAPKILVVCAWAVSGQYGLGTRILFYILVAGCVLARKTPWLRNVCLAAALVVSAVAAIHGIVIAAVHQPHAIDMDIYGALQLSSIGILAAPVTVRISTTYFQNPGRNIIFLWTSLLLAGLMSMTVEFFRATPKVCMDDLTGTPSTGSFTYGAGDRCGLVCSFDHGPKSPIRKGTTDNIEVVLAPSQIPISMAILISAGCCVPAVLMLVSTWLKIREKNLEKKNRQRQNVDEAEKSLNEVIEGTNGATRRRMNSINQNIRELLRVVELLVFTGAIIGVLVMGELNFFSPQLLRNVEEMSSVGQWGALVGTMIATIGSLYVVLAKDFSRWMKGEDDTKSTSDGGGCACTCAHHHSHGPPQKKYGGQQRLLRAAEAGSIDENFTDASYPDAQRPSQETSPFPNIDGDVVNADSMPRLPERTLAGPFHQGSRSRVYQVFTAVNRFLGTAQESNGLNSSNEASQYPTIPGEEIRNPTLRRTRDTWKKRIERSRSNSRNGSINSGSPIDEQLRPLPSGSPRPSLSNITMSPANATTSAEMYRLGSSGSLPVGGGHLEVPEPNFRNRTRRTTSPSGPKLAIPFFGDVPGRRRPSRPPAIAITQAERSSSSSETPIAEAGPSMA